MRFVVALTVLIMMTLRTSDAVGQTSIVLADFSGPDTVDAWITVNDGVMGGLSRGGFEVDADSATLVFRGETSLDNNGGFSSIRMRDGKLDLSGFDGIALRVKGDGREYKLSMRTSARQRGWQVAYWADFSAAKDEWQTVRVPFSELKPTSFGYELDGPALDLEDVRSVGFMLYDKKAGPFRLEVDRIEAYGTETPAKLARADAPPVDDERTIVDVAAAAGTFETLLAAVRVAGLESVLRSKGPFTVLAPTDEAFGKLPRGTVASLLRPENRPELEAVLKNHVFAGRVAATDAVKLGAAKSLAGETLAFAIDDGRLRIGNATVLDNDIEADNGLIHVIDTVLVPSRLPESLPADRIAQLLDHAVNRGVTLFNAGNAEGCWRVYEVTLMALLAFDEDRIGGAVREDIVRALRTTRRMGNAEEAAWELRRAIDQTLAARKR